MKKKIALILLAITIVPLLMGAYIETRTMGYIPLRTTVTADDTALDGTTASYTYQFADKSAKAVAITGEYNTAEIYFYGTDAAAETCNFKVYAYRENGPACLVCTGVVTLGTALKATGVFYGGTIAITDYWATSSVIDSGNNRAARLQFDLKGCKYVYVEIDIPAASEVASISAEISGY